MTECRITRRSLVLALAAAPLPGTALAQAVALPARQQALLDRALAYLRGLTEAQARFVQTDPRGGTGRGTVYLKRPGRARFEYDPPSGLLVVSDGKDVSVQDGRLKTFNKYPLSATPLSLFLARNIRLDRGVAVTRVQSTAGGFTLAARDLGNPAGGGISISFTDNPISLAGWTVTDAQGRATRVRLEGLTRASGLDPSLFTLADPRGGRAGM